MWNLPPPPGFQGIHPDKPLTVYYRHLPHWRQDGATYFVTFRLADSLPKQKLNELRAFKREWQRREATITVASSSTHRRSIPHCRAPHGEAISDGLAHELQRRIEVWLDQGMGDCVLKDARLAEFVKSAMHYFDGDRYELGCYVIMPNHVHVVVRPLKSGLDPLEDTLGSWKKHSGLRINRELHREGALWQEECYDRIIRDEEHLWRVIQYIGGNPARAGLAIECCPIWINPNWVKLGWKFADAAT